MRNVPSIFAYAYVAKHLNTLNNLICVLVPLMLLPFPSLVHINVCCLFLQTPYCCFQVLPVSLLQLENKTHVTHYAIRPNNAKCVRNAWHHIKVYFMATNNNQHLRKHMSFDITTLIFLLTLLWKEIVRHVSLYKSLTP